MEEGLLPFEHREGKMAWGDYVKKDLELVVDSILVAGFKATCASCSPAGRQRSIYVNNTNSRLHSIHTQWKFPFSHQDLIL